MNLARRFHFSLFFSKVLKYATKVTPLLWCWVSSHNCDLPGGGPAVRAGPEEQENQKVSFRHCRSQIVQPDIHTAHVAEGHPTVVSSEVSSVFESV